MPTIQIKHVPAQTHEVLRRRAAQSHQSLQEYLLKRLIEDAARPTLDEALDRIESHSGGTLTFGEAVESLRAARDRR